MAAWEWGCVWWLDPGQAEEGGGCYQGERQTLAGSPDGAASCSSRLRRDAGTGSGDTRCCKAQACSMPPRHPATPHHGDSGLTLFGHQSPLGTKPGGPLGGAMVPLKALAFTG